MLRFSPWKTALILGICLLGLIFALPNVLPRSAVEKLPQAISQKVSLGLDLQGGAHLLVEVDTPGLIKERLTNAVSDLRSVLLNPEDDGGRIPHRRSLNSAGDGVTVVVRNAEDIDRAEKALKAFSTPGALLGAARREFDVERIDGTRLSLKMNQASQDQAVRDAVAQSVQVIIRRLDSLGTKELTVQPQGKNRILVQVPGITSTDEVKAILNKTAKLTFHLFDHSVTLPAQRSLLADENVRNSIPLRPDTMWVEQLDGDNTDLSEPWIPVLRKVEISGENLRNATQTFEQQGAGQPAVSIMLDTKGTSIFGRLTQQHVGRRFAILLDGQALTAPNIREPIPGGSAIITGGFTVDSATELSILLRSGSLPAKLVVVEERTVGPEMGADSIQAGKSAVVIGFVLVVVFVIAAYGIFGVFANIALIINLILIMAALSALQATLTLPGIAGIVLTIGMAVDANVLIFERIREELRSGKSPLNAVEAGYSRALGTILDANITTFLAAAVLFQFGSGPIKGFAVTLAIGIITSVFTAFTLTRLFVSTWLGRRRLEALPI